MADSPLISEIVRLKKENRRLRKIEHAAWHVCESSEERVKEKEMVVGIDELHELSELLPTEHPPHYD